MRRFVPWQFLLAGALFLIGAGLAQAQVRVDIGFARTLYIVYEPIICTVTITNLSGRTLELADTPQARWFGFQIETEDGRPIPPIDPNYQNTPAEVPAGGRLTRSINLTPIYPLSEFGMYHVKGVVYSNQYYSSEQLNIEITEGRTLWKETVGVPDGAGPGHSRTLTILAHRLPRTSVLYLRVEDEQAGVIYCTTQLGRFIAFGNPDIQLDKANQIHILQNTAPKAFLYSEFDINGKIIKQTGYQMTDTRPQLVTKDDGSISVTGGTLYDLNAPAPETLLPKLSDRPVPLPTPQVKSTPEDKAPENLLSR